MPTFRQSRDFLLAHRTDYDKAVAGFRWPDPVPFNWAIEWFDAELAGPSSRDRCGLWIVDVASGKETRLTFGELSTRSNQVANWLRQQGLTRGDYLLLVLNNVAPLWEIMLAAMKLGVVVIPATTLLTAEELADRVESAPCPHDRHPTTTRSPNAPTCHADGVTFVTIGAKPDTGWLSLGDAYRLPETFEAHGTTNADDPLLLYFHLGHDGQAQAGTPQPSQLSRGLAVDHVLAGPAAGRRASQHLFAGLGQACLEHLLRTVERRRHRADGQPGAVQRQGAAGRAGTLRRHHLLRPAHRVATDDPGGSRGDQGRAARGLWRWRAAEPRGHQQGAGGLGPHHPRRLRPDRDDGADRQHAGPEGQGGRHGPAAAGYRVLLLDADGMPTDEGEICLDLNGERPAGLMQGYADDEGRLSGANDAVYRTGDVASLDEDGYLTFVGRSDDVFKSSDYRISPFELESVLIEHDAVAEAAIVPSPDDIRLSVPKAFILLIAAAPPSRETAQSILKYTNTRLAPFKRIRRLEFVTELPKTISGKIRRNQLRRVEYQGSAADVTRGVEFHEKDVLG